MQDEASQYNEHSEPCNHFANTEILHVVILLETEMAIMSIATGGSTKVPPSRLSLRMLFGQIRC
jgi:hypothetical protein